MRTPILACLAAAALSCRDEPAPTPAPIPLDAAPIPSSQTPVANPAPPAPDPSSPAAFPPILNAFAAEPAGPGPLSGIAETVIDPASSFKVVMSGRLADARLVLLDSANAHVPAKSTRELGKTTLLTLTPASPLVPGSHYVLRVEGTSRREIHDGPRSYAPFSFAILAAGTPPQPEAKNQPKQRSRKRR